MSTVFRRGNAQIEANLTPMIDVTFLLIVFFVLVSQIVDVENVRTIELPTPPDPLSEVAGDDTRAVINVIPGTAGRAAGYRLSGTTFPATIEGLALLTERLGVFFQGNRNLHVNLRADRNTHYEWVQAAMQAISDAASQASDGAISPRVNLAIEREEG